MLAFIQFPIADLRRFAPDVGYRLKQPQWPPKTGVGLPQSFVRAFGPAMRRWRGADYAWLDEQSFCGAARALRFERLPAPDQGLFQNMRCAFRRLLFDGISVARVEIGIGYTETPESERYDYWDQNVNSGFDPEWDTRADPFEVLDHVLGLRTIVPLVTGTPTEGSSYSTRPLILQGAYLARLYAQSTTKNPGASNERVAYDLVVPGNPLVIIECSSERLKSLPKRFVKIAPEKVGEIGLAFGRIRRYSGDLGVWLGGYKRAYYDRTRSVRLCLARIHAEQEVLQATLSRLDTGSLVYQRGEQHSEALEDYLNRATRVVNRRSWAGIQQSSIQEAFEAAEATQERQRILHLQDKLEGARRQIVRKVQEFERSIQRRNVTNIYADNVENVVMEQRNINIGAGATINAPVVMADKIENSFNTLASSQANDELKNLMSEMLKQVVAAGNALPLESAEELARDAETLTKEVSSKNPRRKWYEFSLNNIKETAEAVGEIGKPILEITAKLLPLLVGLFP